MKYIQEFTDQHGKIRRYFRHPVVGRVALKHDVGTAAFLKDYTACLSMVEEKKKPQPTKAQPAPNTLRSYWRRFHGSARFAELSAETKKQYRSVMEEICKIYGDLPVLGMEPRHIQRLMDEKAGKSTRANRRVKCLRVILDYAVADGVLAENPARKVDLIKVKTAGYVTWTEVEIARYIERHPPGTRAHLALMLLLCTGQRRADIVKMGWQHVDRGWINITQQKTGTRLQIPMVGELATALTHTPRNRMTFLLTKDNAPFSVNGFGNYFRDCCLEAGVMEARAHGLRKAIAKRLAEAGCSAKQMQAITGHKKLDELETYVQAASQKVLAETAIQILENAHPDLKSVKPLRPV